jgi:hypothetical protein
MSFVRSSYPAVRDLVRARCLGFAVAPVLIAQAGSLRASWPALSPEDRGSVSRKRGIGRSGAGVTLRPHLGRLR